MRIHLVFAGKTGFQDIDTAISRYVERLRHYVQVEVHVVKAEKLLPGAGEEAARRRESERLLKAVVRPGFLVAWDQRGREFDSGELAAFLEKLRDSGPAEVWMVIGGPLGLDEELVKKADAVLSLARMTFPHDLARLMVAEQLYRAFTILKGEPYHK